MAVYLVRHAKCDICTEEVDLDVKHVEIPEHNATFHGVCWLNATALQLYSALHLEAFWYTNDVQGEWIDGQARQ